MVRKSCESCGGRKQTVLITMMDAPTIAAPTAAIGQPDRRELQFFVETQHCLNQQRLVSAKS